MEPRNEADNSSTPATGKHENSLPGETSAEQKTLNESAHNQAEADMSNDAELTAGNENDDLDEGELARLGEDGGSIQ